MSRNASGIAALLVFTIFSPQAYAQTSPPTFTPLYDFTDGSDGAHPANLIAAGNGSLYGTTQEGGTLLGGTVFELTPPAAPGGAWTLKVLYAFAYSEGSTPVGLVQGKNGELYGATNAGGDCLDCGTVFELAPPASPGGAWTETTLHSFTGGDDGGIPQAGPVIGKNGALYGTTLVGGSGPCQYLNTASGCGAVFELTRPSSPGGAWTETVLYDFQGGSDGGAPVTLTIDKNGVLYGTTQHGGANTACQFGCGAVFELAPPSSPGGAWTETVLFSLSDSTYISPEAMLAIGGNGAIYGTTSTGGVKDQGAVFELTPPAAAGEAWTKAILYSFTGGSDGRGPYSPVIGEDGALYGVTDATVFKLTPPAAGGAWTETSLHHFQSKEGGTLPSSVIPPTHGIVYGAAGSGGSGRCIHSNHDLRCGTIFQLGP